jgi:hypothetical protein
MSTQRTLAALAIATTFLAASAPAAQAGNGRGFQDPVVLMGGAICMFIGIFAVSIWAYRDSQREHPPKS